MDDLFVDQSELRDHIGETGVSIVDAREPFFYAQGHLPGAVNLPALLMRARSRDSAGAESLARQLGEAGIDRDSHVVLYDDGSSPSAAILYWLLDTIGHPRISILNGGITTWRHRGLDIDYLSSRPAPAQYIRESANPRAKAVLEDVIEAVGSPDVLILDVRSPAEYLGLQTSAARDGHIPGALNVDASTNFERDADGLVQVKSRAELRLLYESAGVTGDKDIIVHCQTGARSALTYAVLKNLGYERVRHYDAGWQEWGNRSDTPVDRE